MEEDGPVPGPFRSGLAIRYTRGGIHARVGRAVSKAVSNFDAGTQIRSEPTNVDLVSQTAQGVSGAVRELYRRFSPMAYSLALRIGGNEADAEEVLVDSFFQVWKQAGRYDASRATVAGWILNIVRSRAIDTVRANLRVVRSRQKMEDGEEEVPMVAPPPSPETQAMLRELQTTVQEALNALAEDQRLVIDLAYFSGLSQTEIAAVLGQPLGTVKTRMRLAMQKLRRTLVQE